MNIQRRILLAIMITLSCLFAIQPAGAVNAQVPGSDDLLCSDIGPTPDRLALINLGFATTATKGGQMSFSSITACMAMDTDKSEVAARADVCASMGPELFRLTPGFMGTHQGSTNVADIAACHSVDAGGSSVAASAPKVSAATCDGGAEVVSEAPGLPGEIGPTMRLSGFLPLVAQHDNGASGSQC